MSTRSCQVLVVGAGPGGYVAAIRAAQFSLDTIIVEGDRPGGTCLVRGCIPSKALIHAATRVEEIARHASDGGHLGISIPGEPTVDMSGIVEWKEGVVDRLTDGVQTLLKAAGAELVSGWATFEDARTCVVSTDEGDMRISAEHVILATGSVPVDLPFMPRDGGFVIDSTDALVLQDVPQHVAVIGGGYIGLELGIALRKLGAEVTVVEMLDRVLTLFDKQLTSPVTRWLKQHGVTVHLGARAREAVDGTLVFDDKHGAEQRIAVDKVLVTVGRRPRTRGWGLEHTNIRTTEAGFIAVDDHCRTNMPNVYAIGDVNGEPLLAHKASAEGEMVAEIIAGHDRVFEPVAIPAVVFTEPEITSVGLDEASAKELHGEVKVGRFPLVANGRALSLEAESSGGFVRVITRAADHVIVGIQAVGPHVSELTGEFSLALEMGALVEDIAGTIHAHPTLTEAFHEAALHSLGQAIHITN